MNLFHLSAVFTVICAVQGEERKIEMEQKKASSVEARHLVQAQPLVNVPHVNIDIIHFVLGGIQSAVRGQYQDVLAASPTQTGGYRGYPPGGVLLNKGYNGVFADSHNPAGGEPFFVVDGITSGILGAGLLPPKTSLPYRGGGYRGGGFRGPKELPLTSGGYRGVPPTSALSKEPQLPNGFVQPDGGEAEVRTVPVDQVVLLPAPNQPSKPNRGPRFDSFKPEIVVDIPGVIRDDQVFRPAALVKPSPSTAVEATVNGVRPSATNGQSKGTRPPIVPVTSGGPPKKDFVSQLEDDLVGGLTPEQLEELSFQGIDPRKEPRRSGSHKIIFPGKVV